MNNGSLFLILIILICFSSCKLNEELKKGLEPFRKEIDEFQAELLPLDTAARNLVIGILDGAATESSKDNIDSLTKRLSNGITKYLNERLKEMDTGTIGSNMIAGIRDEVGSQAFKDTLGNMVGDILISIRSDLNTTIDSLFITVSSEQNRTRLESLLASAFSDQNSERMRSFINSGISEISFSSIADSLRHNLLNSATRDSLNSMIPSKIDSILDKTAGILSQIERNNESFFERNIWTIVASIATLMLLGTLLWLWRKNSHTNKMNDVIMASISNMNQSEYDSLTDVIKQNAIQRGVEPSLNRRLVELGLVKDDRWKNI